MEHNRLKEAKFEYMKIYEVPYFFDHEEKIFGGYVSLRQAIYLLLAVMSIGLFFLPILNISIKVILFTLIVSLCCLLAFFKIDGTNADKYLIFILKFIIKKKIFVLER